MKFPQEILNIYLNHIVDSYRKFYDNGRVSSEHAQRSIGKFESELRVEYGQKYVKIISQGGVHSFICLQDDAKFQRGDILKSASWRGPAKNFSRGNLLKNNLRNVTWTGAH